MSVGQLISTLLLKSCYKKTKDKRRLRNLCNYFLQTLGKNPKVLTPLKGVLKRVQLCWVRDERSVWFLFHDQGEKV